MSHLRAAALLGLVAACGGAPGPGAIDAAVGYHLLAGGSACVKVGASPAAPEGLTRLNKVTLDGKPLVGTLHIGILAGDEWRGTVTVVASLHRPNCNAGALASQTKVAAIASGETASLEFALEEK